jgi:hypothetical protein
MRKKAQQIPGCPILRVLCEGWDTTNLDTNRRPDPEVFPLPVKPVPFKPESFTATT